MDLLQVMGGGFDDDGAPGEAHIVVVNELEGIIEGVVELDGEIEEVIELEGSIE